MTRVQEQMITHAGSDGTHAFPVSTQSWHYRLQIAAFGEMPAKNFCPYWRLLVVAPFVIAGKRVVRVLGHLVVRVFRPLMRLTRLRQWRLEARRLDAQREAQEFAVWDQLVRQALEAVKGETDAVRRARRLLDLDALLWRDMSEFPQAVKTRSFVLAWAWKDVEGDLAPSRPSFFDLVKEAQVLLQAWNAQQRRARYGRLAVWGPRALLGVFLAVPVSLSAVAAFRAGALRGVLAWFALWACGVLIVGGTVLAGICLTRGFGALWKSDTARLLRERARVAHDRICPPLVVVDGDGNPVSTGDDDAR